MNGTIDRESAAQVMIALVAVVGAWLMFVQPKSSELAELEQTIQTSEQALAEGQAPVAQLAEQAEQVRERIGEIARSNNAALNSSDLYARIGRLANQYGVIVQNMRPGSDSDQDKKATVQTMRIDLSVEGTYENSAEFLDAMTSMAGFVRPVTMSIAPMSRNGEQRVAVHYVCELLQFTMPEALAAFKETGRGL